MKKRFIIFGVVVLSWIIVMLFSTQLILSVSGRNLKKTSVDLNNNTNTVHFSIDSVKIVENIFKDVRIVGWVFIEDDGINENPEASLFLVSDKNTYQVPLALFDRADVQRALPELKVPKRNIAFLGEFSPIAIENGTYKLYIYKKQNNDLLGIRNTGRSFQVINALFIELPRVKASNETTAFQGIK